MKRCNFIQGGMAVQRERDICKKKDATMQSKCQEREIVHDEVKEKVTIRKCVFVPFFLGYHQKVCVSLLPSEKV